jgi:hypothetical protein
MKVGCRTGNRPEGQQTVQIGRNATLPTRVAVDVSPVMLDRLRIKVAVQHLRSVEVIQAGFFTYGRAGDSAGVVLRGRGSRPRPLRRSGDTHLGVARAVVNRSRIGSRGNASKVQ